MGADSIGWAAVREEKNGRPAGILAMGVRRFEAGVLGDIDSGRDESHATARRNARGPRRLTWRRQYRLRKVFRLLQSMDLLPPGKDDSHDERHRVLADLDRQLRDARLEAGEQRIHDVLPYLLRARALDEKLSRHELGRALYHLAQRRGFLSNLKADKQGDEEEGVVRQGIDKLEGLLHEAGSRTLGEYFAALDPERDRIRCRWTARRMFQHEFEQIWTAQAAHHTDLTDERKQRLFDAIFFQRPLKSQKGLIGKCGCEPTKRRAPTACLEFQHFRVLQKLNNLEVICPDGECRHLSDEERTILLDEAAEKGEITFGRIRALLKFRRSREYGRKYTFDIEAGGERRILGNRTAARLVGILGDRWREMPLDKQRNLVNEILSFESEDPLVSRLTAGWQLDKATARQLAQAPLERGCGSLSRKAISKLLPGMQNGKPLATAIKDVYGETRHESKPVDRLPANHDCAVLRNPGNPTIARALSELRRVVNALLRKYGRPETVRIELARDLKLARPARKRMAERNRSNEKLRDVAARIIVDEMKDERLCTERNKLKVRLAEECNWECPYSGRIISMKALVGDHSQFDIEHIIPFSRSLDNSYINTTLCYHQEVRERKGHKTPYEAYAHTDRFDDILVRVRRFRCGPRTRRRKLGLFQIEKLPDSEEFNRRQLDDSHYISRLAADYLGLLFGGQIDGDGIRRIRVNPGRVTRYLRQCWGLNSLLGYAGCSERADHRHDAIDALVVALMGADEVQLLSRAAEEAKRTRQAGLFVAVDPPWSSFLDQSQGAVDAIRVSSRIRRRLSGKLHKDTIFSRPKPGRDKQGRPTAFHHVRKRLAALSKREVANIVDGRVRRLVEEKLEQTGGTPDKAFADDANHPYAKTADGRMIPIHKVRIRKPDSPMIVGKGSKRRYVNPGSNHHMEIVAVLDDDGNVKKWEGHIVTLFDAIQRHRCGEPIIRRNHGKNRQFKFSLAVGEHVEMEHKGRVRALYRVFTVSGNRLEFRLHSDARPQALLRKKEFSSGRVYSSPNGMRKANAQKVSVDPLGHVRPAND